MMQGLSLPKPDSITIDDVWEKLNSNYQQCAIELLARLAIKLIAREVADDDEKEN